MYLLILVLSPGLYVIKFLRPLKTGWDSFDSIFFFVVADFVYYFCVVFVFSLWADRRWRRRRVDRKEALKFAAKERGMTRRDRGWT